MLTRGGKFSAHCAGGQRFLEYIGRVYIVPTFLQSAIIANASSFSISFAAVTAPVITMLPVIVLLILSHIFSYSSASSTTASSSSSTSTSTQTSQFYYNPTSQYPSPTTIFRQSGIIPALTQKWSNAQSIALLEQSVEDHNAEYVATCSNPLDAICYRRCIVLPLEERLFNPPVGVFSHDHVDTGDKMSLNRNFWDAIIKSKAEVRF